MSVIGECDKRPFMYTLLALCQYLGDVLLVTPDENYSQFIVDKESVEHAEFGHFENIDIAITEMTPDESMGAIGYTRSDYDFIIYDNKLDTSGDVIIYIASGEMTEKEHNILLYTDPEDYTTICYGEGKKNVVHKSPKIDTVCSEIEQRKSLRFINSSITDKIMRIVAKQENIPIKSLRKAVSSLG